jgi:branched-chain amino acid transport system ATP-binding protein
MIGTTVLEVTEVSCGYGKIRIVNEVSFKIHEREIVLIMGPNGSGKSTLVKAVVGLVNIFGGRIMFDGNDLIGHSTVQIVRMGISYVPQTNNLFQNLSVKENLEMGSVLLKSSSRQGFLGRIYEIFPELKAKESDTANTLSGGERQILAIARGLIGEPRILILDEPTAGLSPKIAKNVISRIKEIRDKGVSVLLVEQNARAALSIADTGCVIVTGSKVAEGPAKEIIKNEDVVQLFLGGRKQLESMPKHHQ